MEFTTRLTFDFSDHSNTEPLIAWLSGAYADLQAQAQALVDDYWHRLREGQKGRRSNDRGNLGLRLRARPNGGFSLEWYRMGQLRVLGRDISADYIRKGQSHQYSRASLLKGQPTWLTPIVLEVEEVLSEIRKKAAWLGKIRLLVIHYRRELGQSELAENQQRHGLHPSARSE